jgi:hypothetical protein
MAVANEMVSEGSLDQLFHLLVELHERDRLARTDCRRYLPDVSEGREERLQLIAGKSTDFLDAKQSAARFHFALI